VRRSFSIVPSASSTAAGTVSRSAVAIVIGCGPIGRAVICALKARGVRNVIASDFSRGRRDLRCDDANADAAAGTVDLKRAGGGKKHGSWKAPLPFPASAAGLLRRDLVYRRH
jgi:threonine dehydrogenase-like Zn-dependent dehydrogenase